jgi:hypothetical protein
MSEPLHGPSVWRQAHGLSVQIYRLAETVPLDLRRFIRERTIMIPANISREGTFLPAPEQLHMLQDAFRQVHQLEYLLLLSQELGHIGQSSQESNTKDLVELRKNIHQGIILLSQKRG